MTGLSQDQQRIRGDKLLFKKGKKRGGLYFGPKGPTHPGQSTITMITISGHNSAPFLNDKAGNAHEKECGCYVCPKLARGFTDYIF